jgi:hypothetical protein
MKPNELFMAFHFLVICISITAWICCMIKPTSTTFLLTFVFSFIANLSIAAILALSVFKPKEKSPKYRRTKKKKITAGQVERIDHAKQLNDFE